MGRIDIADSGFGIWDLGMADTLKHLLGLVRFSHTVFALPFALMAAVMAWVRREGETGEFPVRWQELVGILLCMVTARSAAMAFNRLVDRELDADNPRTRGRHLPAGILSVPVVWLFFAASAVGFIASSLLFLPNQLPLYLSALVLIFL